MIHHAKLNITPGADYKPPRPGRILIPWHLHPRATRGAAIQPGDLTPFIPPIGNQDAIGECTGYGTKDGISTSLTKAGHTVPGYLAALPLYRAVRCLERAAAYPSGTLPTLTDSGASPDDVFTVATRFGIQTTAEECGETGPSDALSQYEDAHVNDEPPLGEFEQDAAFKVVGAFDIVSTGDQRIEDVASALAAGYAVGISVYAADARFQDYVGGVMPDPPAGAGCDHWNYLAGCYLDATSAPIFTAVNSWSKSWGESGLWRGGAGHLQASDCLIAYAVTEVSP